MHVSKKRNKPKPMHSASVRKALAAHKSKQARRLLKTYDKVKRRWGLLQTPEQWAGSLLVMHGGSALAALDDPIMCKVLRKPDKVRRLLAEALDAELAAKHGRVACALCERADFPTMAWRAKLAPHEPGEVAEATAWCCPRCREAQQGEPN